MTTLRERIQRYRETLDHFHALDAQRSLAMACHEAAKWELQVILRAGPVVDDDTVYDLDSNTGNPRHRVFQYAADLDRQAGTTTPNGAPPVITPEREREPEPERATLIGLMVGPGGGTIRLNPSAVGGPGMERDEDEAESN